MKKAKVDAVERGLGRALTDNERSALTGDPFPVLGYGERMFDAGYQAGLRHGKTAGIAEVQR